MDELGIPEAAPQEHHDAPGGQVRAARAEARVRGVQAQRRGRGRNGCDDLRAEHAEGDHSDDPEELPGDDRISRKGGHRTVPGTAGLGGGGVAR